jgi:hypothetical protein
MNNMPNTGYRKTTYIMAEKEQAQNIALLVNEYYRLEGMDTLDWNRHRP